MQVMSAVGAMQAAGHDKPMVLAASYPPLQRTQGRGTQSSGTKKARRKGGPPATQSSGTKKARRKGGPPARR